MMSLVLAALIQAQQPTVDDRIAAFLKGDAAARAELVKLGAGAIPPLQKSRDKGPEKIDALVYELKKAAAYPKDSAVIKPLEAKLNFKFENKHFQEALDSWQEQTGINFMLDLVKPADLKADVVDFSKVDITAREALDLICRQVGLDYGLFHNVVVIARPARLWGDGKARGVFGPAAPERQHVAPEDQAALEKVRKVQIDLSFKEVTAETAVDFMKAISGIEIQVAADSKETFSIRVKDLCIVDVLSLVTQCLDLDYVLEKGDVVIDTRAKIEKRVAGKK